MSKRLYPRIGGVRHAVDFIGFSDNNAPETNLEITDNEKDTYSDTSALDRSNVVSTVSPANIDMSDSVCVLSKSTSGVSDAAEPPSNTPAMFELRPRIAASICLEKLATYRLALDAPDHDSFHDLKHAVDEYFSNAPSSYISDHLQTYTFRIIPRIDLRLDQNRVTTAIPSFNDSTLTESDDIPNSRPLSIAEIGLPTDSRDGASDGSLFNTGCRMLSTLGIGCDRLRVVTRLSKFMKQQSVVTSILTNLFNYEEGGMYGTVYKLYLTTNYGVSGWSADLQDIMFRDIGISTTKGIVRRRMLYHAIVQEKGGNILLAKSHYAVALLDLSADKIKDRLEEMPYLGSDLIESFRERNPMVSLMFATTFDMFVKEAKEAIRLPIALRPSILLGVYYPQRAYVKRIGPGNFGLFASYVIPPEFIIGVYNGLYVYSRPAVDALVDRYKSLGITDENAMNLLTGLYCDATEFGTRMKFANHSCEFPNVIAIRCTYKGKRYAVFVSICTIMQDDEIFLDYGYDPSI